MEFLYSVSEYVISSYFLASILNLLLSKRILHLNSKSIQNSISIVFIVGLSIFYTLNLIEFIIAWYNGAASQELLFPELQRGIENIGYNFMFLSPILALLLNSIKILRSSKIVVILTYFVSFMVFLPRIMSFLIVYQNEHITLANINRVYLNPIILLLITGFSLYSILVLLNRKNRLKKESVV